MITFLTENINDDFCINRSINTEDNTNQVIFIEENNRGRNGTLQSVTFWYGDNISNIYALKVDNCDPPIVKLLKGDAPLINCMCDGIIICQCGNEFKAIVCEFKSSIIEVKQCSNKMSTSTAILHLLLSYSNFFREPGSEFVNKLQITYYLFYLPHKEQKIYKTPIYRDEHLPHFPLPQVSANALVYEIECPSENASFPLYSLIHNNCCTYSIKNRSI